MITLINPTIVWIQLDCKLRSAWTTAEAKQTDKSTTDATIFYVLTRRKTCRRSPDVLFDDVSVVGGTRVDDKRSTLPPTTPDHHAPHPQTRFSLYGAADMLADRLLSTRPAYFSAPVIYFLPSTVDTQPHVRFLPWPNVQESLSWTTIQRTITINTITQFLIR